MPRELSRSTQTNLAWKITGVKVRDLIKVLEKDGWIYSRTRGSHHQFRHPIKPGVVTVPGRGGDDLAPGTLASIYKQAGLK